MSRKLKGRDLWQREGSIPKQSSELGSSPARFANDAFGRSGGNGQIRPCIGAKTLNPNIYLTNISFTRIA